jgi:hypothetical protein
MKTRWIYLFLVFLSSTAFGAELKIIDCNASSVKIPKLTVQLAVNGEGKFIGRYAFGKDKLYSPSWVNFGDITTPPVALPKLLDQVNHYRDTGIDPAAVKGFQNVFVDGNGDWDLELWKLMDGKGNLLGWMAYAFGGPLGCYPL